MDRPHFNVKDAINRFLCLSADKKYYDNKIELMQFINKNIDNNQLQFISNHNDFIHYLHRELIYWFMPTRYNSIFESLSLRGKCESLVSETIKLFDKLIDFMQETPWNFNDNLYKIYETLVSLIHCYHTCRDTLWMKTYKELICRVIHAIEFSIYDIYTYGTQSLYDFSWFHSLIRILIFQFSPFWTQTLEYILEDIYGRPQPHQKVKEYKIIYASVSVLAEIIEFKHIENVNGFMQYIDHFSCYLTVFNEIDDYYDLLSLSLQIFETFAEILTEKQYNTFSKYYQDRIINAGEAIIKNYSKYNNIPYNTKFSVENTIKYLFKITSVKEALMPFVLLKKNKFNFSIIRYDKPITTPKKSTLEICIVGYCRKQRVVTIPREMLHLIELFHSPTNPYGNDYDLWNELKLINNKNQMVIKSSFVDYYVTPIFINGNTFGSEQVVLSTTFFFDLLYESNQYDPYFDLCEEFKWEEHEINEKKLEA
eukprot:235777_1